MPPPHLGPDLGWIMHPFSLQGQVGVGPNPFLYIAELELGCPLTPSMWLDGALPLLPLVPDWVCWPNLACRGTGIAHLTHWTKMLSIIAGGGCINVYIYLSQKKHYDPQ